MYHWPARVRLRLSPAYSGRAAICFNSSPGTTQGEAEFVGRLARKYYWHRVAVVTITRRTCAPGCGSDAASHPLTCEKTHTPGLTPLSGQAPAGAGK